jgi:hypothetical protein
MRTDTIKLDVGGNTWEDGDRAKLAQTRVQWLTSVLHVGPYDCIDLILLAALWPWRRTQPLTEMNTRNL